MSNNENLFTYRKKVHRHNKTIAILMKWVASNIMLRSKKHDIDLKNPDKEIVFTKHMHDYSNIWGITKKEKQKTRECFSEELNHAIISHIKYNDYIPSPNRDIRNMTFIQLIEMSCDLVATAKEESVSKYELLAHLESKEFQKDFPCMNDQLMFVLYNTISELWKVI